MKTRPLLTSIFTLTAAFSLSGQVVVTGDVTSGSGVLSFLSDYTFVANADADISAVVFDEWVVNDGLTTASTINANFSYQVNGGPLQTNIFNYIWDNKNTPWGDVTANDGVIIIQNAVSLSAGDTFTIKSGTWNMADTPAGPFNAPAAPFTGDLFISDPFSLPNRGFAIPEPSLSAALMGCLILGSSAFRRRRRR